MAFIHLRGRSNLSDDAVRERMESMAHLVYASHDINDWEFTEERAPEGSAKTTDHIFMGKCKKTGITQPWPIDMIEVDEQGSFQTRHTFIIEHFTESLIWLREFIAEGQARAALGQRGLVLPNAETNLTAAAKAALWRGDHPNSFN